MQRIKIETSWREKLAEVFADSRMQVLRKFLLQEKQRGAVIYPVSSAIFAAFDHTPFDQVKVVILGQDPYHGPSQAHGLSFSVPEGVALPPSLQNIFKELYREFGAGAFFESVPQSGNLSHWAKQGVLLLNAVLTVEAERANAHQGKGWEFFTDAVVALLQAQSEHVVFMLWGNYARQKGQHIDRSRHLVLESTHPSPLSAHRGFLGCGHFATCNAYLEQHGKQPIDWRV